MQKNKLIAVAAALLFSAAATADEGVLLRLADGTTAGFAFSEKPTLLTGDSLVMQTTAQKVAYAYSDIKRVEFGDVPVTPTAIAQVNQNGKANVSFRLGDGGIEVVGLQRGEHVAVYGVNGTQVACASASADNATVNLPLPQAGRSVYIVRTSTGVTFKFINK